MGEDPDLSYQAGLEGKLRPQPDHRVDLRGLGTLAGSEGAVRSSEAFLQWMARGLDRARGDREIPGGAANARGRKRDDQPRTHRLGTDAAPRLRERQGWTDFRSGPKRSTRTCSRIVVARAD